MRKLLFSLFGQGNVKRIGAVIATALLLFANTTFAQVQYAIKDLGTLGYDNSGWWYSQAYGVNNNGQVVGYSPSHDYYYISHTFLYSDGRMQDLGTLIGATGNSWAYGINNNGQVVGQSSSANNPNGHAFLYSGGSMQDLGTLIGINGYSCAQGINDNGQVVGYSAASDGGTHAFLYSDGRMQDLGTLSIYRFSYAYGINNNGQVVGWADTTNGRQHAFVYSEGHMHDLGTLRGMNGDSCAYGINDNGQVVGYSSTTNLIHAFLYSGGSMQDLGTLGGNNYQSFARSINNSGQIVGFYRAYSASEPFHAFLVSNSNSPMRDLNDLVSVASGWTLADATAINEKGQIAGYGKNPDGYTHAFLLSPIGKITETNSVPANSYLSSSFWPIDVNTTPPSGNLKKWDGSLWQSITNWTNSGIDTNQPTVVIVHGWNDSIKMASWNSSVATALYQQNSSANILGYDWSADAVSVQGRPAMAIEVELPMIGLDGAAASATRGSLHGIYLARELKCFGINSDKLQLIGHSNGGAVVGSAASEFARHGKKVRRITTLDTPNLSLSDIPVAVVCYPNPVVRIEPWLLPTSVNAIQYVKADSALQVEVYYSGLEPGRNAFGFGEMLWDSNATNVFNGLVYHGNITNPFDPDQRDHNRIPDWYWGKNRTPQSPGSGQFVAGIDWSILTTNASNFRAGIYAEQSFNSGVFGQFTREQLQPTTFKKLWFDGFDTGTDIARNWLSQHAEIFMRNASDNFAAWLKSGSDGYLYRDVFVPTNASYLTFDMQVVTPSTGDFLTVTLGPQVIFYQPLNVATTNFVTVAPIFVGNFTGQTQTLLFTLNHVGSDSPSILIDDVTFLAMPPLLQTQDYVCTTNNGTVTIVEYIGQGNTVTIPDKINGMAVTSIRDGAFYYCTNITAIYFLGNAPTLGGTNVFNSTNNLAIYYMPGTTGWGETFGGRPATCWKPRSQNIGTFMNQFGFSIDGGPSNLILVMEGCTNLVAPVWVPVATNTLTGGSSYFVDSSSTNYQSRFYRLRAP